MFLIWDTQQVPYFSAVVSWQLYKSLTWESEIRRTFKQQTHTHTHTHVLTSYPKSLIQQMCSHPPPFLLCKNDLNIPPSYLASQGLRKEVPTGLSPRQDKSETSGFCGILLSFAQHLKTNSSDWTSKCDVNKRKSGWPQNLEEASKKIAHSQVWEETKSLQGDRRWGRHLFKPVSIACVRMSQPFTRKAD